MRHFLVCLLTSLLLISCHKKKKEQYLPDSVGSINSLTIVMDPQLWGGVVGDSLREYFASPVEEIAGAREPLFDIQQIPLEVFDGMTRAGRNILIVSTDTRNGFDIRDSLYAKPQKVAFIIDKLPTTSSVKYKNMPLRLSVPSRKMKCKRSETVSKIRSIIPS